MIKVPYTEGDIIVILTMNFDITGSLRYKLLSAGVIMNSFHLPTLSYRVEYNCNEGNRCS